MTFDSYRDITIKSPSFMKLTNFLTYAIYALCWLLAGVFGFAMIMGEKIG